jgi:hypothetical protein
MVALDGLGTCPTHSREMIGEESTQGSPKGIRGRAVHRSPPVVIRVVTMSPAMTGKSLARENAERLDELQVVLRRGDREVAHVCGEQR